MIPLFSLRIFDVFTSSFAGYLPQGRRLDVGSPIGETASEHDHPKEWLWKQS